MLVLNPEEVTFGDAVWADVSRVEVSRFGEEVSVDWGDDGPHAVFCDVPRQRVLLKVVQVIGGDDLDGPVPGDEGVLSFEAARNASGVGRSVVTATAVVTSVGYGVGRGGVSLRTVAMTAVSSGGAVDPVTSAGA